MEVYIKTLSSYYFETENNAVITGIPEEVIKKINDAKSVSRKREILGGYILLKETLNDRGVSLENVQIGYGKKGKPYIDGVNFNISHSADFIALVLGENECGIDMLKITPYKENICKKYFTEKERKIIQNSKNKDEFFTFLWCIKEAYFKMTGEGITVRTKDMDFSELLTIKIPFKKEVSGVWFYCDKIKENYLCVCSEHKENVEVKYE